MWGVARLWGMSRIFEELAFAPTPIGDISLRRQRLMMLGGREVYEIKLGDGYLMSSLFTVAEVELAKRGLAAVANPTPSVVVGGLGLGYTAGAALDHPQVRELIVVDYLAPVIEWHRQGLVPLGAKITADPRTRIVCGDFFAMAGEGGAGFDPDQPGRLFDAILLDIDNAPRHLLHSEHARFYNEDGLRALRRHLVPGGIFAMWSDSPTDEAFLDDLQRVFAEARADVVPFENPFLDEPTASIVYVARRD
jgi:spermidine synthase